MNVLRRQCDSRQFSEFPFDGPCLGQLRLVNSFSFVVQMRPPGPHPPRVGRSVGAPGNDKGEISTEIRCAAWLFWDYLATIELTNHVIDSQRADGTNQTVAQALARDRLSESDKADS